MADLQVLKPLLHDNPLCGIDTYKDTLNLATGACTRKIKKLVLTGEEPWTKSENGIYSYFALSLGDSSTVTKTAVCSHFVIAAITKTSPAVGFMMTTSPRSLRIRTNDVENVTVNDFTSYLAQQYAAGTPVTIWYVLAEPTTETITVPSGLSGTEEGYLTQSETPTPTNPVYPTANEVLIWQHSLRKFTTATDTITTLPANLYADGNNATVGISGNMVQSGTPTPDNPIQPSECGERTENLFDYTNPIDKINNKFINKSGTIDDSTYYYTSKLIVTPNTTYTWRFANTEIFNAPTVGFYDSADSLISVAGHGNNISYFSFTTPANCAYIRVSVYRHTDNEAMLNTGSSPLPYEPYGYKIPISSASTTTPVYLGEVETTRRIKKLVLTGDEDWKLWLSDQPDVERYYYKWGTATPSDYGLICTHLPFIKSDGNYEHIRLGGSNREDFIIFISRTIAPTVTDFKSYLTAQYAAGTPVTVWYVLASPTTGIVNEPIRKIGDYADTVSGITIPTIAGANSFDVLTTLKPSEVTANYHGWHTGAVHERDSGQWE